MTTFIQQHFTGERALFKTHNAVITHCVFDDGESPLKESKKLTISDTTFGWKYPLWYCTDVQAENVTFTENGHAGVWYTSNIEIKNSLIAGDKNFRKAYNIIISNTAFLNAAETLWWCSDISLTDVEAKGDYFAMGASNITVRNFKLSGNYGFDGCSNVTIDNAHMLTKDAFWNTHNVTVKNSTIIGEYIGWNSKNLTFENCTIQSSQGLCYIEGLTLINCKLINTDLCFEYCSDIDATITSSIDSAKNPINGKITAEKIDELIFNDPEIDKSATIVKQQSTAVDAAINAKEL